MSELSIQNISKSFGNIPVLKNVSLTIRSGEVHALLGKNGAGKSTLMKMVCGDYERDSGSILLNGEPLPIHTPSDAKKSWHRNGCTRSRYGFVSYPIRF
ncbi:ATP-binding cassette domain-containing protein [Pseudalkalibacillus sp. NRS-1564]|uniref:ATP-binding cassette domain-containing protein n=1 Tax=Pseudalkalibacillus sp. NRS-1564 TaxID=3233900 RepID=UPI003D2BB239